MSNDNMRIYHAFEHTPDFAKKPIAGGRLKGKTDVNPMHRIKLLTERFGPYGLGWYTDILSKSTEKGPNGELMCFIDLNLYYRESPTDGWSAPVFGTGGNTIITKESNGLYANDEGWKMAYTDALSVACKGLGMCADVYFKNDYSKYSQPKPENNEPHEMLNNPSKRPTPPPRQPATPPPQGAPRQNRMASEGQKLFIIENMPEKHLDSIIEKYGADLSGMTYDIAKDTVEWIQRRLNNAG